MHVMQNAMNLLRHEMGVVVTSTIFRLVVAAILGGIIGLERQLHRKPAGLRTNLFICFGAAMFTIMSDELAAGFGGDHTRVAAQIIPGIGFIGAGSILHSHGSVTGLTTAATLFVVASVGMAAGGGLYITAVFATVVILICLAVLGKMERHFELKSLTLSYEVSGRSVEEVVDEVNRVLEEEQHLGMQNIHAASTEGQARVVFSVDCEPAEHETLNIRLRESQVFSSVKSLGGPERE
jgi:putative Mg2+ transporter-C (MgtC) family protein